MLTADDFYDQLTKLLPPGPAWDMGQSVYASQLLEAWAEEMVRIYARAQMLVDEADPRSTLELLADYERIFGLPTDCIAGIGQTVEQRRQALVAQMISTGGQSRAYFIALAAAAGFTVTITEFEPFTVMSAIDYPLYDNNWRYAWQVNAPATTRSYFTVMSGINEPLSTWGNELLECLLKRFKPAHSILLFAYS